MAHRGEDKLLGEGALFRLNQTRFDDLLNLPKAADIGGATNGAMKAIALIVNLSFWAVRCD